MGAPRNEPPAAQRLVVGVRRDDEDRPSRLSATRRHRQRSNRQQHKRGPHRSPIIWGRASGSQKLQHPTVRLWASSAAEIGQDSVNAVYTAGMLYALG
jgi:hypothetical protein